MEHYTTQIIVNGEFRTILIYKSETPIIFEDYSRHSFTINRKDSTLQIVYITNSEPYREVIPEESDSGSYYFYWFLVERIDTTEIIVDSEQVNQLKEEFTNKDLDNKMAIAEVYEMLLSGGVNA